MTHSTVRWLERATRMVLAAALIVLVACTHARDGAQQVDEDDPTVTYQYSDKEGLLNASFQAEAHCRQFNAWPHIEEVDEGRRGSGEATFTCSREQPREAPRTNTLPRDPSRSYNYHDQQSLIEASMEAQRYCARYGAEARAVVGGLDEQRQTAAFECVRAP